MKLFQKISFSCIFWLLLTATYPVYAVDYYGPNQRQESPGTSADIDYAKRLWERMKKQRLVGPQARKLMPFLGAAPPHGWILELASQILNVGQHRGFLVVKKNYNGDNLRVEDVEENRAKYLASITVMYQREAGYDIDNDNWFWVKYKPQGELFSALMNGQQVSLAGRLAKGKTRNKNTACLYCHSSAGGGDYIFYPHITLPTTEN